MLFNSYAYIFLFLPFVFFSYYAVSKFQTGRLAIFLLVIFSILFYIYWNIFLLPFILVTILVNFSIALVIRKSSGFTTKKTTLIVGIIFNVSLLIYYKYSNFLIETINHLENFHIRYLNIILPLGISFFTFTQIAFLVDCAKDKVKEVSLTNYFLFVTFFPHLLAGPIIHHSEMMPQFSDDKNKKIRWENVYQGLCLFAIGLFKKTIIADYFAFQVDPLFLQAAQGVPLDFWQAWIAALGYSIQLYYDFSGYTDMAIGSALLFNIKLPLNFNSPYQATSIQDFWRRWHMTLSRFLRDYIYIPLGGNRVGKMRTRLNIMLVFLIGGIWHGAGWTFILWGFLHGLGYSITEIWNFIQKKWFKLSVPSSIWMLLTFLYVTVAWIFFRSPDFKTAHTILVSMFYLQHLTTFNIHIIPVMLMVVLSMILPNSNQIVESFTQRKNIIYASNFAAVFWLGLISINLIPNTPFIYFQF